MITKEKACIIAYHYFPELEKKQWVQVVDGYPRKFTPPLVPELDLTEDIWCIQYSPRDKELEVTDPHSSHGIFISKATGKILYNGTLSDEG